jgi:SAM-dependent methyltransferase
MDSCPACGSAAVTTAIAVNVAPTSDGVVVNAPVDTAVCSNCGFAFNTVGARGKEATFYSDAYDLLAESAEAEFVYETDSGVRGINDDMAEYIVRSCGLKPGASVLDVGCGKGLFLRALGRGRGDLVLHGVEPSRHARRFSERVVPGASIYEGLLAQSPFASRHFDLVTCVGVFEHVPDPVGFARDMASRVASGGRLFLSVPNLANNPADVVTYDHLSRFTPATFRAVLGRAGLIAEEVVVEERVPMWALARRAHGGEITEVTPDSGSVARDAAAWFGSCLDVYRRLDESPGSDARRIGVYGTGLILPAAAALGALDPNRIVAFFDDNPHMQGATRLDRPVRPLADAPVLGITDMAFSANPVYLPRMLAKVEALGASIRTWPLPAFISPAPAGD